MGWNTGEIRSSPSQPTNEPAFPTPHQPHCGGLCSGHGLSHQFLKPRLSRTPERPPTFTPSVRAVVTWVIIRWVQQKLIPFLVGVAREQLCKPILVPPFSCPVPPSSLAPCLTVPRESLLPFGWQGCLSWPLYAVPDSHSVGVY